MWQYAQNVVNQGSSAELQCLEILLGLYYTGMIEGLIAHVAHLSFQAEWYCMTPSPYTKSHCWGYPVWSKAQDKELLLAIIFQESGDYLPEAEVKGQTFTLGSAKFFIT